MPASKRYRYFAVASPRCSVPWARATEVWQRIEEPPLEDWLELLDALRRSIQRRPWVPKDEAI